MSKDPKWVSWIFAHPLTLNDANPTGYSIATTRVGERVPLHVVIRNISNLADLGNRMLK